MKEDNIRELLKSALNVCMDMVKGNSGSIFLWDDRGQELVLKIAHNGRGKSLEGIRQKLGEGISGLVASKKEPLLVENIDRDPRFQDKRRTDHYQTNSFLSIPLMTRNRLVGVINIGEKDSREPFTSDDLKCLTLLSAFLAAAIYETESNKKARKEKSEKQIEISEKFASLGKLVAGIAHELNNPLDGAMRYTNLSLDCANEDGVIREYLLEAKKGLNRMAKIIRSLLDLAHQSSPVLTPVDINEAIDHALRMMNPYILSNNIEISKQFHTDLPLVRDNGLKLVFINILKNACDAMPKGGKITIFTTMTHGGVKIKISDTGPGIPEEIKDRIFEPFITTKEIGKGSGLGLAICYDIVQRYNGKIAVESKEGEGAIFTIQLPITSTPSVCKSTHEAVDPSVYVTGVSVRINNGESRPVTHNERIALKAGDVFRLANLRYGTFRKTTSDGVAGEAYLFKHNVESYENGLFSRGFPITTSSGNLGDFKGSWSVEPGQHRVFVALVHYFGDAYEVDDHFSFTLDVRS